MDPRGPAGVDGALARLAAARDASFPALAAARARTADGLDELRGRLAAHEVGEDASVVLLGSWGRRELTAGSDDDWMLLVEGAVGLEREALVNALARALGAGPRKPGTQGLFGGQVETLRLATRIGLQSDDNRNLTQRMLLLLESVPLAGEASYHRSRGRVLDAYLDDAVKDFRPPRFLLNDVIRYWRTICVDFVGKEREARGGKWALRNAKLRTSRKVLFAGGLLPVLWCHLLTRAEMGPFLAAQLDAPPVDRLAFCFLEAGAADAGVRALGAYDRWVALLDDPAARAELELLAKDEVDGSDLFIEVRRLGDELEDGLLALLFETGLRPIVREYGVF